MKQCPNPNCIFYTRLEELPDAYIKCPGCGGMLADADMMSGKLSTGSSSKPHTRSSAYTVPPQGISPAPYPSGGPYPAAWDEEPLASQEGNPQLPPDQAYAYTYPNSQMQTDIFALQGPARPYDTPYAEPYSAPAPDPYAREYADTGPHPVAYPGAPVRRQRWPIGSRIIVGVSLLLFLSACVIVGVLISDRLFPQARVITAPQATETALASLRPAVNTPIIAPPTGTTSGAIVVTPILAPTREPQQPTPVPPQPTATSVPIISIIPPTETPPPPPPTPTTPPQGPLVSAPTAPPPQPAPVGGVLGAQMSVSLEGGEPSGDVSAYGPTDPFNLSVQANYGPGAVTSVLTRWYGPDGSLLYEMRRQYDQPGTYYAGFTLRTNGTWSPGTYRVDIHTNDSATPAYSVTFEVLP